MSATPEKEISRNIFESLNSTGTKENMTLRKDTKNSADSKCTVPKLPHAPNVI